MKSKELAKYELMNNVYLHRKQFPIALAYAITIHKAQGQTLSSIITDLGTDVFAKGQAYVALSTTRLNDVHLINFVQTAIQVDQRAVMPLENTDNVSCYANILMQCIVSWDNVTTRTIGSLDLRLQEFITQYPKTQTPPFTTIAVRRITGPPFIDRQQQDCAEQGRLHTEVMHQIKEIIKCNVCLHEAQTILPQTFFILPVKPKTTMTIPELMATATE
uniref:ATP-dependent DNA helicase n=1 Tax=Strigamia maritima TaxID=126957 RepID=T1J2E0_STRMM